MIIPCVSQKTESLKELAQKQAQIERDQTAPICRRFRVKDKTKEQAAIALIEKKGLTKDDMKLLLETFELNPNVTEQNI